MTEKAMLRKDYRPLDFKIKHTDLVVELESPITKVSSTLTIERSTPEATSFIFDGHKLNLLSIKINNQEWKDYKLTTTNETSGFQELEIDIRSLENKDNFQVEITNSFNLDENRTLQGIYKAGDHICSQCEAEGFRQITYYFDRPDNLSIFTCKVIGDKKLYPYLLSNGNCIEKGELADNKHYALWSDPFPKPSYLFALVAGDFDVVEGEFITRSGKKVDIKIFAEVGKAQQISFALECIKRAMKWDEDRFGLEYDLDLFMIVAVSFFNMGAMENKGLNIFNDAALLGNKDTASDSSLINIDHIIAHEYFHNWTGNRVTCRDWFQLTLKEGLTVFRDQEYTSDTLDRTTKRISSVDVVRNMQFEEDQGPTSHPIRPDKVLTKDNFYTATVYRKGAEVIRMIHTIIGEANFQKGMKLYFERHDGQAVTCDDFITAMADASGINLDHFKLWYSQSGTPIVTVNQSLDQSKGILTIEFKQVTRPTNDQEEKQALYIPLKTILLSQRGEELKDLKLTNGEKLPEVVILDQDSITLEVANVTEKPIIVNNCDFSAPVIIKEDLTFEELATIATKSPNEFSRYDAIRKVIEQSFRDNIINLANGKNVIISDTVIDVYSSIIGSSLETPAINAMMLSMPAPAELAPSFTDNLEPLYLAQIAKEFKKVINHKLKDKALAVYNKLPKFDNWEYNAEQIAIRSLRAALLNIITANGDHKDIIIELYNNANNFTDRINAITVNICNNLGCDSIEADFINRYQNDVLVMDNLLLLKSRTAKSLEEIKELTRTFPTYDPTNPNRVRRVIGPLSNNYSVFYNKDGSAIRYLNSEIKRCDKFNPHLSSVLVNYLLNFHKLAEPYKGIVVKQLLDLSKIETSNNVSEKVNMALKMLK